MRRTVHICVSLLTVLVLLLAATGSALAQGSGTTFMKVKDAHGAKPNKGGTLLFSHGGPIEPAPQVFIIYWGDWSAAGSAQSYVNGFFTGVGGSSWAASTTQYCQGVASGTTSCPSGYTSPNNAAGQLAGIWNDTVNPLPATVTQSAIATEAAAGAAHFGYNASADYMVFTPSGHSERGFGTQWCAYHSSTTVSSGNLSYSYMPYQPDAGAACGMNFVNGGSAGFFDGFSIVGGHEYAETITDPFPGTGWLDSRGAENGDKCAWISSGQGAATNITLSTGYYAVQSLWSNAFSGGAGGCVISYP